MTLQLPTTEAAALIKENSEQIVKLDVIDEKTIKVGYQVQVNVPLLGHVSKNVSIDLIVDKVEDKDVFLHYSTGNFGGKALVDLLLAAIPILTKNSAVEKLGSGLVVHLNSINWVKDNLDKIEVKGLHFAKDTLLIDFILKS